MSKKTRMTGAIPRSMFYQSTIADTGFSAAGPAAPGRLDGAATVPDGFIMHGIREWPGTARNVGRLPRGAHWLDWPPNSLSLIHIS